MPLAIAQQAPERAVAHSECAPQTPGMQMIERLHQLHTEEKLCWREVPCGQNLVAIVPFPGVRLDDCSLFELLIAERCPGVGCEIERVDEIAIVAQQPAQTTPERAWRLFLKPKDVIHDGENTLLTKQAHRLIGVIHL